MSSNYFTVLFFLIKLKEITYLIKICVRETIIYDVLKIYKNFNGGVTSNFATLGLDQFKSGEGT